MCVEGSLEHWWQLKAISGSTPSSLPGTSPKQQVRLTAGMATMYLTVPHPHPYLDRKTPQVFESN